MTHNQEPDSIASLVERVRTSAPSTSNVVAVFILSTLMIGTGVTGIVMPLHAAYEAHWRLPFNVEKGWSWFAVVLMTLLGTGILIGGIFLARFSKNLISYRVDFYANGFRHRSRRFTEQVLWSEVASVRETIVEENLPLLKGPAKRALPAVESRSYSVVTKQGTEIIFDGNVVQPIRKFGLVLWNQATSRSVPWEIVDERERPFDAVSDGRLAGGDHEPDWLDGGGESHAT
jgi:hypothetical protein